MHTHKLPPGEVCDVLVIWNIKKDKRYICMGTNSNRKGRLSVFSLKRSEKGAECKMNVLGEYPLTVYLKFASMLFLSCC